jgi:hypothetical protein
LRSGWEPRRGSPGGAHSLIEVAIDTGSPAGLPLIGRREERERIETALRSGESLLVLGCAGAGKSCLLRACADEVPGTVFLPWQPSFHLLLSSLADALVPNTPPQTSVRLKGILWTALERQPARVILDGIAGASHPFYRFFQRLYFVPGMSIIASARDAFSLGALGRLFWDSRKTIQLGPLSDAEARELFDTAAKHYGLSATEPGDFCESVLECAKGNGGQIVEMCRLGSRPEYMTASGHIKFELVRIDSLVRTLG